MQARGKRWILSVAGIAVVGIVAAGIVVLRGGMPGTNAAPEATVPSVGPREVATDYVRAFARGDTADAAKLTDEPTPARRVLTETASALRAADATVTLADVRPAGENDQRTSARMRISWRFGPERVWTYENTMRLRRYDSGWLVDWTPALVHPKLTSTTRLAVRTREGTPAVLAGGGEPLLVWRGGDARAAEGVHGSVLLPGMAEVASSRATDGWSVDVVDGAGNTVRTLLGEPPAAAEPLKSTVSLPVSSAAQAAVDSVGEPAMLVAMRPSTGEVLAVAQNAALGGKPRALTGLYPPGSTFKIATAAATLRQGLADLGTVLPCPGKITIGSRTIPNSDEFDLGEVPLRTAFAESCNTTFARLATRLPANGLSAAAARFGLNTNFVIPGITTELGTVEPAAEKVQRMEDGIGQGNVVASPFGVALMAATVARGEAVTPTLFSGIDTTVKSGYQAPSSAVLGPLRTMMRAVVTSGTATQLNQFGKVYGKTGTAETGDGPAHGWFAGYRADVAFATLVADAGSHDPALAVTAKFLDGV